MNKLEAFREVYACIMGDSKPSISGDFVPLPLNLAASFTALDGFCFTGEIPWERADGKNPIIFEDEEKATLEELDKLKSWCHPAKFGRGNETVYDPNVRSALSCDASEMDGNFFNAIDHLVPEIVNNLAYYLSYAGKEMINLEPYRLNIYGPGDFFRPHVDSVSGPETFATLVVSFPVQHTGGHLVVRRDDQEKIVDFSATSGNQCISWAAFYADCQHEILPIESGTRVTMTFKINYNPLDPRELWENEAVILDSGLAPELFETTAVDNPLLPPTTVDNGAISALLRGCYKDAVAGRYPKRTNNVMGLILFHRYVDVPLPADHLKGIDRSIYEVVKDNFQVSIIPIVIRKSCYSNDDPCDYHVHSFDSLQVPDTEQKSPSYHHVPFFGTWSLAECLVHTEGAEYCGNEAMPENFYYRAYALILTGF